MSNPSGYYSASDFNKPESALWRQIRETQEEVANKKLWEEIRQATKDNVTLQAEFERLKVIYFLSKKNSEGGADGG